MLDLVFPAVRVDLTAWKSTLRCSPFTSEGIMSCRFLSFLSIGTGVVLLSVSVYGYFCADDQPGATIEETDRQLPSALVGVNQVSFRLHNPTRHAVRIVGSSFC